MKPGLADICFSISSLAMIILPRAAGGPGAAASSRSGVRMAMSSRCTGAHRVRPATVAQAVVAPASAFGHRAFGLDRSGDVAPPLHWLDGRVVLGRRIGIGP